MSLVATFDVDDDLGISSNHGGGSFKRPRIRHSIYLGGKADAKDYDKLVNRWKITHVLNCTPPKQTNIEAGVANYFEKPKPHKKQLTYCRIPIYDTPTSLAELKGYEPKIIDFISKGLHHGNVLVHCSRGVSRSTTSVILYLMAKRGFRLEDALATIRRRRPSAQPIPAFENWLQERDVYYWAKRQEEVADTKNDIQQLQDSSTPKTKKQKIEVGASIGPALPHGVSIGPTPPAKAAPARIGPERPTTKTSPKASAIGPGLPPKSTASSSIGPALDSASSSIGPKTDSPKASIGPELPPKPSIGPELP